MKKSVLVALLTAALGAAGAFWWSQSRPPASGQMAAQAGGPAGRAAPQTVNTVQAEQRDVPVVIEAAGSVVALDSVELRPQVASTVRSIAVREGQAVRKGELLFSFDDRADRANLDKARAQLLRDRATLADLQRQLARAQELLAQNFIAPSATDTLRAQVEAQQATLRADEAAVQAGEVTLGYSTLRAPLSGRIGAIAVRAGSLVQPNGAALATINQIDPIGVSFTVPEGQLGAVLRSAGIQPAPPRGDERHRARDNGRGREPVGAASPSSPTSPPDGAELQVLLPAERGRAGKGQPGGNGAGNSGGASEPDALTGRLSFVDNAVDASTGTIRVKGSVPNPQQRLWPGQYVTVRLQLRTLSDAVVIPQAAVIQRGNERSVYVVGADGHAELRPVQARYPFGELLVVEGVQPGEQVVVDGKQNLRPGVAVRVAAAPGGRRASGAGQAASGAPSGAAR